MIYKKVLRVSESNQFWDECAAEYLPIKVNVPAVHYKKLRYMCEWLVERCGDHPWSSDLEPDGMFHCSFNPEAEWMLLGGIFRFRDEMLAFEFKMTWM